MRLLKDRQALASVTVACAIAALIAAALVAADAPSGFVLASAATLTVLGLVQAVSTQGNGYLGVRGVLELFGRRGYRQWADAVVRDVAKDVEFVLGAPLPKSQQDITFSGPPTQRLAQHAADKELLALARRGDPGAYDRIVRRYYGFVRFKASSYLLTEGHADDLIEEGLVGIYKAVRDFRPDWQDVSFKTFVERCITLQIIVAVKTAGHHHGQHVPVSMSGRGGWDEDTELALDEVIAATRDFEPSRQVIAASELESLVVRLSSVLSERESRVLSAYLDGHGPDAIADDLQLSRAAVEGTLDHIRNKLQAEWALGVSPAGVHQWGREETDRSKTKT